LVGPLRKEVRESCRKVLLRVAWFVMLPNIMRAIKLKQWVRHVVRIRGKNTEIHEGVVKK
jgi:hypothetical protein